MDALAYCSTLMYAEGTGDRIVASRRGRGRGAISGVGKWSSGGDGGGRGGG